MGARLHRQARIVDSATALGLKKDGMDLTGDEKWGQTVGGYYALRGKCYTPPPAGYARRRGEVSVFGGRGLGEVGRGREYGVRERSADGATLLLRTPVLSPALTGANEVIAVPLEL